MEGMAATTVPRRPPPLALPEDCALFLDVDGTLLEFASQPHLAGLLDGALEMIGCLSDRLHGSLAQIDRLFAPLQLPAAGLRGQELRDAPPFRADIRRNAGRRQAKACLRRLRAP